MTSGIMTTRQVFYDPERTPEAPYGHCPTCRRPYAVAVIDTSPPMGLPINGVRTCASTEEDPSCKAPETEMP